MRYKRSLGSAVFDSINTVFLTALSITCIYPVLYVIFASLSEPFQLIRHEGLLYRSLGFTLEGYKMTFRDDRIITGYLNTAIYVGFGTIISLFFTCMAAYCLSRKRLKYTKYIMYGIVFTMFFSGGLIPFYLLIRSIGLYNTRGAIILPGTIAVWNLIVMRTSFAQLPDSLEESAFLDGANDFIILFWIIVPISKPVVFVILLFYAVNMWNSWFNAAILLQDHTKFPLQLVLRNILLRNDQTSMTSGAVLNARSAEQYRELLQYCTIVAATIPVLCFYPFIQKHFVKGIMIGALKG